MTNLPDLLAALEVYPDDPDWIEQAQLAVHQIVERLKSGPLHKFELQRNAELISRLAELIRGYHKRLRDALQPSG